MMMDPLYTTAATFFLATLLLLSGTHKVIHRQRFRSSVAAYRLLPKALIGTVTTLLPVCELLVAATLPVTSLKNTSAVIAVLIFGAYAVAMAVNIIRGHTQIDCGCSFLQQTTPISWWHLARNAAMLSLALVILLPGAGRELGWLDIAQITAAVLTLGLLYLSVDALLSNRAWLHSKEI